MDTTICLDEVSVVDERAQQRCAPTGWVEEFSGWLGGSGKSELTVKAYVQDVGAFAKWFEGVNGEGFEPGLVTGTDLRGYRGWAVSGRVMAASTWNRRRVGLKMFCAWAVEAGLLTYNPFQGVEEWAEQELPPRWLSSRDFSRFMRQVELGVQGASTEAWKVQAARDAALVGLMVYAGLREGEVAALNLGDVVLGERTGRVTVWAGKGTKKRVVPLGLEARRALEGWMEYLTPQPPSRNGKGESESPLAPLDKGGMALFTGKGSARLSVRGIQRRVAEIGRRAGLDVSPHDLRHTFAKRLLDKGVQLTVVSKLLGHARLDTTARYVQPGWDDFEKAVE